MTDCYKKRYKLLLKDHFRLLKLVSCLSKMLQTKDARLKERDEDDE